LSFEFGPIPQEKRVSARVAPGVEGGIPDARVGPHMQPGFRIRGSQRRGDPLKVVLDAQCGTDLPGPQPRDEDVPRRGLAHDHREVLMLVVKSVEEGELLLAVGRVVGRIGIDRDDIGHATAVRSLEPLDAELDREVDRTEDRIGGHRVLEPRERRLARESLVVGEPVGDHLEDRVVTERVVVVAVLV
jgi:hypothetical protein